MIHVAVLGSTGTVGCRTLDVLALHPDRFRRGGRWPRAATASGCSSSAGVFDPEWAALESSEAAHALERALRAEGSATRVVAGAGAIAELAADAECRLCDGRDQWGGGPALDARGGTRPASGYCWPTKNRR